MFDIITETFLQQYFLYSAVLGKYADARALFNYVADLFFIEQAQRDELYDVTLDSTVREIATLSDAKRFARINQYREIIGETITVDKIYEMVALKSSAIEMAMDNHLIAENNATQTSVYNKLLDSANAGNVIALRVLGAVQCEGGFVEKRYDQGLRNLNRGALWGDMVCLLALIKYASDRQSLVENVARLHAVVRATEYESLYHKALGAKQLKSVAPSSEILLLKKAFATNRVKSNFYDPMIARLLYSNAIDDKDKEKILFSDVKTALSEVCDLPLKLTYGELTMDVAALDAMPLKRDKEISKLATELRNVDLRQNDGYHPICISGASNFVLETYVKALLSMEKPETDHFERIDVADLKPYDFDPTVNNIFIRSAVDGKNNVFVLAIKGDVEDYAIDHVKNFLYGNKRRRFHLNNPRVTLNLAPILPICVCDKANATKLASVVEKVKVADIAADEKRAVVADMLASKSLYYLFRTVDVAEDVVDALCNVTPDTAESVIDRLFSENRFKESFDRVTSEELKPYAKVLQPHAQKAYGFGGFKL